MESGGGRGRADDGGGIRLQAVARLFRGEDGLRTAGKTPPLKRRATTIGTCL
jgi:hypothetical protein